MAEIFSLPLHEQQEIFALLSKKLGDEMEPDNQQILELDRRLDRIARTGSQGKPWDQAYAELSRARDRRAH